uniref:Tachylectin-2 n=3 Tax=Xenopus tropicalis TaxID=8364 RepID=A0A6I8PV63_XENTR
MYRHKQEGIVLFTVSDDGTVRIGRPPKNYLDSYYDRAITAGKLSHADHVAFHPGGDMYVISGSNLYQGSMPSEQGKSWISPDRQVGKGEWNRYKFLLFHPNGDLYAVTKSGHLYKGPAPNNENISWGYEQATKIGDRIWNDFSAYFFDPEGMLYVVTPSGDLRKRSPPTSASDDWLGTSSIVGQGSWKDYTHFIRFTPDGYLWCVENSNGYIYRGLPPANRGSRYVDKAEKLGCHYHQFHFTNFTRDKTIKSILGFDFLIDSAKTLSQSIEVVEKQVYNNARSTTPLKSTFSFNKTIKEVSEFTHEHGFTVAVGAEMTFTAGIPFIGDTETKVSLNRSTTHNWKFSSTNEREVSFSAATEVEVEGGKAVRLEATIRKAEINIPYRATVRTLFGYEATVSGTWNGVSHFDLVVKQEDVTPNRFVYSL